MDKLIVDDRGNATISNDGATIMKLLDVVHPSGRTLVDIAKSQDAEVCSFLFFFFWTFKWLWRLFAAYTFPPPPLSLHIHTLSLTPSPLSFSFSLYVCVSVCIRVICTVLIDARKLRKVLSTEHIEVPL